MTRTMGDRRYRRVCRYVARVQHEMRLDVWDITVARTVLPRSCGDVARIRPDGYGPTAALTFSRLFFDAARDAQRQTVVHELTHLMLNEIDRAVIDVSPPIGSKAALTLAQNVYQRAVERTTDTVACVFHRHLPLPPRDL